MAERTYKAVLFIDGGGPVVCPVCAKFCIVWRNGAWRCKGCKNEYEGTTIKVVE